MSSERVELFKGRNGRWYFRHVARNGEKIAQSQGYTRKGSARRGALRAVPGAAISVVA